MRVLLDHNLPHTLRRLLPPHDVWTTRFKQWVRLLNGELLRQAAADGFDAMLTIDKAIEHQQNLARLPLAVVQLDASSPEVEAILPFLPATLVLLTRPLTPSLYVVAADASVLRLTAPRAKP
jgi:hypothetical protein